MIQRCWRFSRIALLVALMTGCATVNDMRAQKASGLAQSYPAQPDRAWQIAHAVLDATSAVAIEEHQPDGYLVADTPAFLWGWPTRVAVWIDPERSGSRVTVRCRLVRPGPFPRALSEEKFHQAFARRVTQLAHEATTPPEGDPVMTTRWPCILLAMFYCLLALAASAHAECAWVLWLNHTGVVAGEGLDMWIPLNASTNNPDCQQVLASALQANARAANPGDAVRLRGSNMIDIVSAAGPHTLLYVCLPDTVDPRGPKGK